MLFSAKLTIIDKKAYSCNNVPEDAFEKYIMIDYESF